LAERASIVLGVFHILAANASGGVENSLTWPDSIGSCREFTRNVLSVASAVSGVRHKPPPLSEVWRSGFGSRNNCESTLIPELGKLSDHGSPIPVSKDAWHVLQHDEAWSHLANDSERIGPQISVVRCPGPLPGNAMRLAGEASRDEIHASTPGSPVKGLDIVPDGGIVEQSVPLTPLDDLLAPFVPLDVADGGGVKSGQSEAEGEPSVSGEQVEDSIVGTYIHVNVVPP